jgi:hypothetical protein
LIPKNHILCLAWTNGCCKRRSKQVDVVDWKTNEILRTDTVLLDCPFAHPDLSEVPEGVCATMWFTGYCRFNRNLETEPEATEACEEDWGHQPVSKAPSGDTASTGDDSTGSAAPQTKKGRKPAVCGHCHHVQPPQGRVLLPGLSRKMSAEERELALRLYPTTREC